MTLTNVLPTLRRSIPDPLNGDCWPELTSATTTDIIVPGVSHLRLVEICGTPCIHTAAAVIPGTHGRPSPLEGATTVVVTVTTVEHTINREIRLRVDGLLRDAHAVLSEARLIGRASTARTVAATVLEPAFGDDAGESLTLPSGVPADIRVGDLLVLPCRGLLALRDVHSPLDRA